MSTIYREWSNLVTPGQMSDKEQSERWQIFMNQAKMASREGLVLVIGDTNLDLERFDDATYYKKDIAEKYQQDLGEGGFELINFGIESIAPSTELWELCYNGVMKFSYTCDNKSHIENWIFLPQ